MDLNTMNIINRQNAAHGAALNKQLVDALTPLVQAIQIMEFRIRRLESPLYARAWERVKVFWASCKLYLTRRKKSVTLKSEPK